MNIKADIKAITYGNPLAYIKEEGNVKRFLTITRNAQFRNRYDVERTIKNTNTGVVLKSSVPNYVCQEIDYVITSILLAVNAGYQKAK